MPFHRFATCCVLCSLSIESGFNLVSDCGIGKKDALMNEKLLMPEGQFVKDEVQGARLIQATQCIISLPNCIIWASMPIAMT